VLRRESPEAPPIIAASRVIDRRLEDAFFDWADDRCIAWSAIGVGGIHRRGTIPTGGSARARSGLVAASTRRSPTPAAGMERGQRVLRPGGPRQASSWAWTGPAGLRHGAGHGPSLGPPRNRPTPVAAAPWNVLLPVSCAVPLERGIPNRSSEAVRAQGVAGVADHAESVPESRWSTAAGFGIGRTGAAGSTVAASAVERRHRQAVQLLSPSSAGARHQRTTGIETEIPSGRSAG
jgi:hypothetical protein